MSDSEISGRSGLAVLLPCLLAELLCCYPLVTFLLSSVSRTRGCSPSLALLPAAFVLQSEHKGLYWKQNLPWQCSSWEQGLGLANNLCCCCWDCPQLARDQCYFLLHDGRKVLVCFNRELHPGAEGGLCMLPAGNCSLGCYRG